jgi:hypothetical protein
MVFRIYPYKCLGLSKSLRQKLTVSNRGSQRDVVYLGLPIAPSYMSLRGMGLNGFVQMEPKYVNFGDLTPYITYGFKLQTQN